MSAPIQTAPPLELSFPQICLLVCVITGRVKAVQHRKTLSLVLGETESLRHILPADNREDFWIPRRPADRKRFNIWRRNRSRAHKGFSLPCWTGEARPMKSPFHLRTNFPSAGYLKHLVSELGYDGRAAVAALVRSHIPWVRPINDRRRAGAPNADEQSEGKHREHSSFVSIHPYHPEAPVSRSTTGGGFRKEEVTEAISRHRWDDKHSTAVFEVVYLRRKPFLVAKSLGLKLGTVYNYCSRLKKDLQGNL
jgi:hypothetical protein